jgi:hypothetical protein
MADAVLVGALDRHDATEAVDKVVEVLVGYFRWRRWEAP